MVFFLLLTRVISEWNGYENSQAFKWKYSMYSEQHLGFYIINKLYPLYIKNFIPSSFFIVCVQNLTFRALQRRMTFDWCYFFFFLSFLLFIHNEYEWKTSNWTIHYYKHHRNRFLWKSEMYE